MPHLQANTTSTSTSRGVLLSLSLSMLMASLGTSSANVALPELAHAFSVPFQAVQWVVIAYLLTITAMVVSVGRLGDLIGRRRLMLNGLMLFTLASAACGASPSLWLLIAARMVQGLGAAIMMALTMALVSETIPKDKAGSAMGTLGAIAAVGTALGPTLGGLLIGACGWQSVFWVNVPMGLLTILLAHRCLPPDQARSSTRVVQFDYAGTLLLTLALSSYALATTLGQGRFGWCNLTLLLLAAVAMGFFIRVQARSAAPLVRLDLFRHPVIGLGFVSCALVTVVVMTTLVAGPFYLSGALGLTTMSIGLVMSVGPGVAALVGAPAGKLVDRFGGQRLSVGALSVMLLGTVVLPGAAEAWGVGGYAGALALITGGYAAFQAANNTTVMGCAAPDQRGLVSGLLNLSRNLGLITGASLMGAVFRHGTGVDHVASASAQALNQGVELTFMVAAGMVASAAVAAVLSGYLPRRRPPLKVQD